MPHAFRMYKFLKGEFFSEDQAFAIGDVLESARRLGARYERERVIDRLFDGGLEELAAEALCNTLRHCFSSEKSIFFDRVKLKTELVRAGIKAPKAEAFLDALDECVVTSRRQEVRRPIMYAPGPGKVVMCDFRFLSKPEMQKERRAVVISARSTEAVGRCIVVPVSMSPPRRENPAYDQFPLGKYACFHRSEPVWAVCDHVYTLSLNRLWHININHRPTLPSICPEDLTKIRGLVGTILGCGH